MYKLCKIKVNDAFILICNLTPLNLSHELLNGAIKNIVLSYKIKVNCAFIFIYEHVSFYHQPRSVCVC